MAQKRTHINLDPDYEDVTEAQSKRRRVLEEGAKEATKRKIENIIHKQFDAEIQSKQNEIIKISETLERSRNVMDRLRAVIVANYYGNACQQKSTKGKSSPDQPPVIHPTVKKFLGKAPPGTPSLPAVVKTEPIEGQDPATEVTSQRIGKMISPSTAATLNAGLPTVNGDQVDTRSGRFKTKRRIVVGNVSKSIPADQRDENDQATHKWMVYIRGSKERPQIDDFVKKVWFFLHPSYRPNDLVEVSEPPFHLTRRGWGEFPVRVQIHFKDSRNKKLDIIHNLKLDRTYTGLQTLGAETVVDLELERNLSGIQNRKNKDGTLSDNKCTPGLSSLAVKQEVGAGLDETDSSFKHVSFTQLVQNIKPEPVDHDYGKSSCSVIIQGNGTVVKSEPPDHVNMAAANICFTANPVLTAQSQTMLRPSVVATQSLSLVPLPKGTIINSPNKFRISPQSSPAKGQGHATPPVLSPVRNVIQNLRSVTLPSSKVLMSSSFSSSTRPLIVSSSPSAFSAVTVSSSNVVSSPSPAITVTPNSLTTEVNSLVTCKMSRTGIPIGTNISPVIQTGLRLPGSQLIPQNRQQGNQSVNQGLVFLKCTDNQGKTYLIPQQVCTSLSPSAKSSTSAPVKSSSVSQAIFIGQNKGISQASQQPLVQLVSASAKNTQKTANNVHGVQTGQNGPVLFIKPEGGVSKASQSIQSARQAVLAHNSTPVKLPTAGNTLQIVRGIGQNQNMNVVNLKVPGQSNATDEKQSLVKGQLMVTSQGLIQVQGQANATTINTQTTNGEKMAPNQLKQPIVLVPTSNKNIALHGKTKSLLSPVVNNLPVSHSSGNIIVLNQSASLLANGNTPRAQSNMTASHSRLGSVQTNKSSVIKGNASQSDMVVLQASNQPKSVNSYAPNHLVIIPVTSEKSVTMTTSSQSMSSAQPTLVVSSSGRVLSNPAPGSVLMSSSQKNDKTMFIVVQNDKGPKPTAHVNVNTDIKKSMSSLLGTRLVPSTHLSPVKQEFSETQVMLTSTNNRQKQIILVNKHGKMLDSKTAESGDTRVSEKKIIDLKKKKINMVPEVNEIIRPLCLSNYKDMLSLIQAAICRHPLVSDAAGQTLHPYCARSADVWLSWNLGKRRASEWQRASSVRRFVRSNLDESATYNEEPLWTTRQIVSWCRLHAYSPHYLERPLHPTGIDLQAETSLLTEKQHRKFSSLSNNEIIAQEVTSLQENITATESSDEEVDIISDTGSKPSRHKTEEKKDEVHESHVFVDNLPPSDGAMYITKAASQIGLKLEPTEVEPGYFGTLSHGVLYKAMERFMGDILRETFAIQVNMGRYPDALGVADVYKAVNHLPITDFLTNKHLGVEDPATGQPAHR